MLVETRYFVDHRGDYSLPADRGVVVFGILDDAVAERDRIGGDAVVYRAEPLPESAHWDWAVDHGFESGPTVYINERAARGSRFGDGKLLRRRRGTVAWQAVA